MQKVAVLFNPSSGKGKSIKKKDRIERCLHKNMIDYDLFVSESEEDLKRLSAEKIRNYEVIVGVGGDTTLNIIATEILKKDTSAENTPVLGMIGTGSVNDIVQGLGIHKIESACRLIKQKKMKKMDVGYVETDINDDPFFFLGTMSSGLGTTVNLYVENFNLNHKVFSKFKFSNQIIPGLMGIHNSFSKNNVPVKVRIEFDDIIKEIDFSLLAFLNTPCFADGMKLSPYADPFDGVLDCCVVNSKSFLKSVFLGIIARKAKHIKKKETSLFRSDSFKVSAEKGIDFQVDGQIVKDVREFKVSIISNALNILTD